jgi:hypothetical protein
VHVPVQPPLHHGFPDPRSFDSAGSCHARASALVQEHVSAALEPIKDDDEAVKRF